MRPRASRPPTDSMTVPSPAFTSVSARRTLMRPTPTVSLSPDPIRRNPLTVSQAPPVQSKPAAAKKMDWPQSVRNYVQRAFAPENAIKGIDRVDMESKLKEIISKAAENETLNNVDWDAFPLPQAILQADRAAQYVAPTAPWQSSALPPAQNYSYTPAPYYPPTDQYPALTDHMNGNSKKRKSMDIEPATESTPPWRKNKKQNAFGDRLTYASQQQADQIDKNQRRRTDDDQKSSKYQPDIGQLEERRKRFANGKAGNRSPAWPPSTSNDASPAQASGPIIGTCQNIEKEYLRLTAPPKPETVRPVPILRKTLRLLKDRHNGGADYGYINSQFKSLRQDLTVQHVRDEFTVEVYETHAKVALTVGDMGEYNQCQTQLRALYMQNLGGHPKEFLAYRILYLIYTCNRAGQSDLLADLTPADKAAPEVKHALDVRSALALGNYHKFFKLYDDAPNFGSDLMLRFIDRERIAALANICSA
jgi:SAC3 family protein LENG8/THP3